MAADRPMTLGAALTRSAAKHPAKKAVQDHRAELTYRRFNQRVNRLANALVGQRVKRGERIAALSSNCLELMELFFACLKVGVVPCPLDTRGVPAEQRRLLELAAPGAFAFHPDHSERAEELRRVLEPDALMLTLGDSPALGAVATEELIRQGSDAEPSGPVSEDDTAFILFTGGATGTPKGVELTHRNLLWNALNVIAENRSPHPESVICYPMQIYHSGALSRFLASVFAGGTFIALPKFDAAMYLDVLERERGNFVVGNQAIWRMLLDENARRPRDLNTVAAWLHAQGEIDPDFHARIQRELFPQGAMYASYALTEAGPGVTVLKPSDRPRQWPGIGRPYMSVDLRLADDLDRDVLPGEVGQILVRGPNVMRGYFRNPAETEKALAGGWLHTGDLARADDLGFLYFVDRIKDVIKTGGLNVYAREVEEAIAAHPQVVDAAVIGVPDPKWGETVRAVVVRTSGSALTAEDVIRHCRARLAGYKKPTSVVFVPELPKDAQGHKTKKALLRARFGRP